MKTLFNIKAEVDNVNLKKLNFQQRSEYFSLLNRIEYLFVLKFFISLRKGIRKHVYENYFSGVDYKINYCGYGLVEFENVNIHEADLNPLISDYIQKIISEIESKTLTLQL